MLDCGEVSCEYCSKDKCIYMTNKNNVLDKIRAEIEALNEKVGTDYKICVDKSDVLQIIDKYREGSEKA